MTRWRAAALVLSSVLILPAHAQSRLAARMPSAGFGLGMGGGPGLGLGLGLGLDHVPADFGHRGPGLLDALDQDTLRRLTGQRRAAIRRLLRTHGDLVEADPDGDPVVRHEIVATFPTSAARARATALGFTVIRDHPMADLGLDVVALAVPPHWSLRRSLRTLRAAVPEGTYDYDQIYFTSGTPAGAVAARGASANARAVRRLPKLGLIDTGIDASAPVFRRSIVHTRGFGAATRPAAHGTAVASLLVRGAPADLYVADVYCGMPTGGSAESLIAALAWLARHRVPVINVSLVGPKNRLLAQVIAALLAKGYVIVAAVGNDGPAAPPLYPAAYPQVVGVTGVDARGRVLLEAERGPQVTFAALGAGVPVATVGGGTSVARGTSFAAPTVAALFGALMDAPHPRAAATARAALIARAVDLGARGWDPIYGYGLLGAR